MSDPILDSDDDVEFEDVLPPRISPPQRHVWTPELSLPRQRSEPLRSGSDEEIQIRGRLSKSLENIHYRQMKSELGMDASGTPLSQMRYTTFKDFAYDVDWLVDMLWASATPSLQVEGLITLAGMVELAIKTYQFEAESMLTILHKFDAIFSALFKGTHPISGASLPGASLAGSDTRPLVTQTQKVRIRSLAETTRATVFASMSPNDSDEEDEDAAQTDLPWMMEATRVYDRTLTLIGD